jgi:hypothetical protein
MASSQQGIELLGRIGRSIDALSPHGATPHHKVELLHLFDRVEYVALRGRVAEAYGLVSASQVTDGQVNAWARALITEAIRDDVADLRARAAREEKQP